MGTTVDQLQQSGAEQNPNILSKKRDFERIPTVAKALFTDNEVTKNSNPGDSKTIRSIGVVRELAIRQIVVDRYFVERARGR